AAGSDDQVRVGLASGVQLLVKAMLVDLVGGNPGGDERACGVDDLGPPGIVEGDVERHALPATGPILRVADRAADVGSGSVQAADDPTPDALCAELIGVW